MGSQTPGEGEVVLDVPADEESKATAALEKVQAEGLLPARPEHVESITYRQAVELGHVLAASGYFTDAQDAAKAAVKVMAGSELGFAPIASITGVHIVEGKPSIGGNLLAALLKRDPHYDYRIAEFSDERCEVVVTLDGADLEPAVAFTIEDAQRAGLANKNNWKHYPRKMLFWRALSWAVDLHCPHLAGGVPLLTTDELDDGPSGEQRSLVRELSPPQQRPPALADERAESLRADLRAAFGELKALNPTIMPPGKFNNQVANAEHSHERLEALLEALRDLVETEKVIAEGTERLIAEGGQAKADEVLSATLRMSSRRDVRAAIEKALDELAEAEVDPIPDAGENKGGDDAE